MQEKENRLGVNLIVFYTWIGAICFGLFATIVLFILIQDPGADGICIGILALFILSAFTYIHAKVANMTSRYESKGWWGQIILSIFGLFSLNPISLIILIYLLIIRKSFGI